jgi:hypothetical protein
MLISEWMRASALRMAAVGLIGFCACTSGQLALPAGELSADPEGLAAELRQATEFSSPIRVNFSWTLEEQGSRVRGNGVVRSVPDRIRLDLFGQRGDTYLIAALVGSDYRLPPQVTETIALPSPVLLWGALGVLKPPAGAALTTATTSDTGANLLYEVEDQRFAFTFRRSETGAYVLEQVQRAGRQGVIESVTLEHSSALDLSRVRYRDWSAFRDLTLEVDSIQAADTFPSSIWSPDASSR